MQMSWLIQFKIGFPPAATVIIIVILIGSQVSQVQCLPRGSLMGMCGYHVSAMGSSLLLFLLPANGSCFIVMTSFGF